MSHMNYKILNCIFICEISERQKKSITCSKYHIEALYNFICKLHGCFSYTETVAEIPAKAAAASTSVTTSAT